MSEHTGASSGTPAAVSAGAAASHQGGGPVRFLCISQNIGSIDCSEDGGFGPKKQTAVRELIASMASFTQAVARVEEGGAGGAGGASGGQALDVLVVHFQEVGGKKHNDDFNAFLKAHIRGIWPGAGWCSGLLMQESNCNYTFTAMASVVFVSRRLVGSASILSAKHRVFVALEDDPATYVASSVHLFHGKKFSDAEKSRKGFLLTTLRIATQVMHFINIHLYHDADNRVAVEASPSQYAPRRTAAFREMGTEVQPFVDPRDPCFIFGDFNTRLDGMALIEYARATLGLSVRADKKAVAAPDAFWDYVGDARNVSKLLPLDREMDSLVGAFSEAAGIELAELPIQFPPTYVKDDDEKYSQMDTATGAFKLERCQRPFKHDRFPAWCDRLLMNPAGMALVSGRQQGTAGVWKRYMYESVVFDATDHDGVFLWF